MLIHELLKPGALRIEFQPIVEFGGADEGSSEPSLYLLEALTRGPKGSSMERADVLFEYARRKGEETTLDLHCIRAALEDAAELPGEPHLSLNVHGSTLSLPEFADSVLEFAQASGIAPHRLMVEILEHRSRWAMEALHATLLQLRSAGVRIAVDDLGVGASNYHMLIDCRPDHLKIDRYIVRNCTSDSYRQNLLRSIVGLGSSCGATLIAEGIENAEDLAVVRELGIKHVQGWHFSRSLPASEIAESELYRSHLLTNGWLEDEEASATR
jgi:EAL domain-containing protein (putative c-di-GMP-specific phosphodiesterase class I)